MPIVNKGVFEVTDLVYERQLGNDWPTVAGFLTSDVTEAPSNLYYTNARVQAYLDSVSIAATGADLSGNTTTDLAEGDNLYYTNSRVLSHLAESNVFVKSINTTEAGVPSISSASSINLSANGFGGGAVVIQNSALRIKSYSTADRGNLTPSTGDVIYNTSAGLLQVYTGSSWTNIPAGNTTANISESTNLYYTNSRVQAYVESLGYLTGIDLSGNTTTDLSEGDNLYYTNARVQTYVESLNYLTGIDLSGNTTTDLAEGDNLYYTNSRVQTYVESLNYLTGIDLSSNTTTDLTEGDNLYYTNSRVQTYLATSDIVVKDLNVVGNLYVAGDVTSLNTATLEVEDKNIVLANGAPNAAAADGAGITIDGANVSILYDSTDDRIEINTGVSLQGNLFVGSGSGGSISGANVVSTNVLIVSQRIEGPALVSFTTDDLTEGSNLYYTNVRVQSYLDQIGFDSASNIIANLSVNFGTDLSGNTTTDLAEGDNLYYTNVRVQSYLDQIGFDSASNIIANINNLGYLTDIDLSGNTTTDLSEGDNLYYTNARVLTYVESLNYLTGIDLSGNTTTDLAEGDNLYYTNARVLTYVESLGYLTGNDLSGNTTTDLAEGVNLYYTNSRVQSYIGQLGLESTANILANLIIGTDLSSNTTTDLAEGDNLYYTNSRVLTYVESLNYLTGIDLSGNTTTDLAEGDNLYYTNSRVETYVSTLGYLTGVDLSGNTTTDLTEGDNLYYTNARVLSILSTSDVAVQDLNVAGNLYVAGDVTSLNTATLEVEDKNIVIANGAVNAAAADGAGITIDGADATIFYNYSADKIEFNKGIIASVTGNVSSIDNHTTTDLIEGDNLYYTNSRVASAITPILTTANVVETNNLYYTNARVKTYVETLSTDLSGNTSTDLAEGDNLYYTNVRVQSYLDQIGFDSAANIVANIDVGMNLSGNTTTDLAEGANLYYTNSRVISALSAGRGISISSSGVIASTDDSADFNLEHDGHADYRITSTMARAVDFTALGPSDSAILRSMHLTNISDEITYFSANIVFGNGRTVVFANCMPIPQGTSLEMLKRPQIFGPNDIVNLQGFNNSLVPTSNVIDAVFTYETVDNDSSFESTANTATVSGTQYEVANAENSFAIYESIKLINLEGSVCRANVYTKDANNLIRAYWGYRVSLPPNSSLELLQGPKKLNIGDKLIFDSTANAAILVSYRRGDTLLLRSSTTTTTAGSNVTIILDTTIAEDTTIYYTIQ